MRVLGRVLRQADAEGRPLLHAAQPRQHVVLLAHSLLGPLDRDRVIARVGFHPILVIGRPLAQRLLADFRHPDDLTEEVDDQLGPRQRRQIAVNDNPIEAVIDEDQELAEQLGEDVHRFAPRNGRSKPDRAKLCATALGFDSSTRFATSSDGPPLMTDASSPPTSWSCSRPKQAMLGSSTPPITSPPASPATATRNPSPSRKPTPASKSLGPEAIASTDRPSSTPIATAAAYRPSSAIRRTSSQRTEISNIFWLESRLALPQITLFITLAMTRAASPAGKHCR